MPRLNKRERQNSCQRIAESSAPLPSYYILTVLSTLIAAYGLLANSTATVIGAMIVAPLMGPILGLALGTVLGDARMFRRSLIAEITGVVLVILTALLVAMLAGPEHIDYSASEIAGRVRPTLYDFAIGLAAGFAGGYCTVHPGLQASVAGVAIAVALVPPLAVTGITGAGWLNGSVEFKAVFGSFMLFFTNLLTIELASGLVFYATGFRHSVEGHLKTVFRRTLLIKAILLLLTGWFLTNQLTNLIQERYGLSTSRNELRKMLRDIPGADLDSINARLTGRILSVQAVVGSRTNIEPATVRRFQNRLDEAIKKELPQVDVNLVVRSMNSIYSSAAGYLFEPTKVGLDDEERQVQSLDVILREITGKFPGVDLAGFTLAPLESVTTTQGQTNLTVTLISPYELTPRFVSEFESSLNRSVAEDPLFSGKKYRILVKSSLVRNYTSTNAIDINAPELRSEGEKSADKRQSNMRALLISAFELESDLSLVELHLRRVNNTTDKKVRPSSQPKSEPSPSAPEPLPTPLTLEAKSEKTDSYNATLRLRSTRLVEKDVLLRIRDQVQNLYERETGFAAVLSFDATTAVESEISIDQTEVEASDNQEVRNTENIRESLHTTLDKLVQAVPGAFLERDTKLIELGPDLRFRFIGTVISPKPLDNRTVLNWQQSLLESDKELKSLELRLENRLGRAVMLTPSLR